MDRLKRRKKRRVKKITDRDLWLERFLALTKPLHPRSAQKVAQRLLRRCDNAKNSMVARSKKAGVPCSITVDDLRSLVEQFYGTGCRYCQKMGIDRKLTLSCMAFDHRVPISKGGDSTKKNIQVICRVSNNMKGSLGEEHFLLLLDWLKTAPEELRKDIMIRLARGIH